jgi:predicted dehydrogenase
MDKIRIGIVGLGPIAQNAHLPAIEKARDIHLQAIADTDAALRDQVRLRYRPETVHTMVAVGHSARHGGDWVNVEEVEGDLAHSHLRRTELAAA